jgi:peptidoglycan hydrolase CwlO-like protein
MPLDELRALFEKRGDRLTSRRELLKQVKLALDRKVDEAIKDLHSGPEEMAMKELQESFEMHLKTFQDLDKAFKRGMAELKESGKAQKQAMESLQTKFDEMCADWEKISEERDRLLEEYEAEQARIAKLALTYKM